jgi:hypothetical protein
VWGADLTLVERELTLVGINPALDAFTDAELMKKTAHEGRPPKPEGRWPAGSQPALRRAPRGPPSST